MSSGGDSVALSEELTTARRRGLDALDVATAQQNRVELPQLELLAATYATATDVGPLARIEAIPLLLRAALDAYEQAGNRDYAALVARLFFDDDGSPGRKRPGRLLEEARQASGLTEDAFDDRRRTIFRDFATFLQSFVAATVALPEAQPVVDVPRPTRPRHFSRPFLIAGGVVIVVIVVVVVTVALVLASRGPHRPSAGPTGTNSSSPASSTSSGAPSPSGARTYTEVGDNRHGSQTYTDPLHPVTTGPPVAYLQQVQVTCKAKAVSLDSVYPDGYWYRISSSPWNGKYYGIANTFLNGDKVGGPSQHNTDFRVPDCK